MTRRYVILETDFDEIHRWAWVSYLEVNECSSEGRHFIDTRIHRLSFGLCARPFPCCRVEFYGNFQDRL